MRRKNKTVSAITEAHIEETALTWFEALGYRTVHGPDIAPVKWLTSGKLLVGEAEEMVEKG